MDMMDAFIRNLKESVVYAILIVITTLSQGFLFIYAFKNALFFKLDEFKLTILSMGIVLPVLLVNILLSFAYIKKSYFLVEVNEKGEKKQVKENTLFHIFIGSMATCLLYASTVLLYHGKTFGSATIYFVIFEVIYMIIMSTISTIVDTIELFRKIRQNKQQTLPAKTTK